MPNWFEHALVILIVLVLLWQLFRTRARPPYPDPAALELIRKMSDDDQRHVQNLATTKGKIEAIKALRARIPADLKVSKEAVELLQAVHPALLKFG